LVRFNPEDWGHMFLENSGNPLPWSHNQDHNTKLSHYMKTFCDVCIIKLCFLYTGLFRVKNMFTFYISSLIHFRTQNLTKPRYIITPKFVRWTILSTETLLNHFRLPILILILFYIEI
jgi:uncharacterized membrane protein YcfT